MSNISELHELITDAGVSSVDFIGYKNRPSIQKDGVVYEIFSIVAEDDGGVSLLTIAIDPWSGPKDLTLDASFRQTTIEKLKRIIKKETSWRFI